MRRNHDHRRLNDRHPHHHHHHKGRPTHDHDTTTTKARIAPATTLRDTIATAAVAAILSNTQRPEPGQPGLPFRLYRWTGRRPWHEASDNDLTDAANYEVAADAVARMAYEVADAMLRQRCQPPQ